jgi:hypothetical protein
MSAEKKLAMVRLSLWRLLTLVSIIGRGLLSGEAVKVLLTKTKK